MELTLPLSNSIQRFIPLGVSKILIFDYISVYKTHSFPITCSIIPVEVWGVPLYLLAVLNWEWNKVMVVRLGVERPGFLGSYLYYLSIAA